MGRRPANANQDVSEEQTSLEIMVEETDGEFPITPEMPKQKIIIENKETKLQTSEYMNIELTEEEKVAAESLQSDFEAFLNDKFQIRPDDKIRFTIPTGIDLLDVISGGGLGTALVQFVAPPGIGKSTLAAKVIATAQKKYRGQCITAYIDSEESMTKERLAQLGVLTPKVTPYSDTTVEKVFQIIEGICLHKEANPHMMDTPSIVVWDSIANSLTESGEATDNMNSVTGEKARTLSHMLPKYVKKLNKYNICLFCINQLRDRIDMGKFSTPADLRHMGNKNIPGGKSLLFNSFQLFYFKGASEIDDEYGFRGIKVKGSYIKNKLFATYIDVTLVFSYEHGFSNFWTNYELLKDTKRIQAGAWCKIKSYPEKTFRQKDAITCYNEDPKFKEAWDREVKDVLQTEYIDKYASTDAKQTDLL